MALSGHIFLTISHLSSKPITKLVGYPSGSMCASYAFCSTLVIGLQDYLGKFILVKPISPH